MKATAIIGGMYGDESKGKHVDYVSSKHGNTALVVRFNGGSQAGHTVVTPEGQRHVFTHFGSGAFNGSPTYLSKDFILNPIRFRKEYEQLEAMGITPIVYVDSMCKVTVPHDMMINQIAEEHRGQDRHGSCGVGIYETITRSSHKKTSYSVFAQELSNKGFVQNAINSIIHEYVPVRLSQIGVNSLSTSWLNRIVSPEIIGQFLDDVRFMRDNIILVKQNNHEFSKKFEHIIFEGAQGLMLDQNNWNYPHVTPSNTGLKNIIPLLRKFDVTEMEVIYLTRAYTTRHGSGKLPYELSEKPYKKIVDETNIPNDWQGSIRFSYLNLDDFNQVIEDDIVGNYDLNIYTTYGIGISCVDQLDDSFRYIKGGDLITTSPKNIIKTINDNCVVNCKYISDGMTRNHVQEIM